MSLKTITLAFAALVLITVPLATTPAQSASILSVGTAVIRRAANGDRLIDSVISRNGANVDIARTRVDASGTIVARERRLRRTEVAGIVERTTNSEFVLRPRVSPRLNEKYACGFVGAVSLVCTMLEPEMITTPIGRIAARRVLMATRSADAAYTELWIDQEYGIVRSRGRSDSADDDFDLVEIYAAGTRRAAVAAGVPPKTIAATDAPTPAAVSVPARTAERHRGMFLQFGGGFAARKTRVPSFAFNGHDSGIAASAQLGGFVSPHVAMLLAADGFRNQAVGDVVDGAFVQYPTPRYEQLVVAGPSLLFSSGSRSGLFVRFGGGIAIATSRLYSVANRSVVGGWNYRGTSMGYNAAIGALVPLGEHFALTPFVSALAVPSIDVRQLGTNALAMAGARHVVTSFGMTLGTK